MTILKKKQAVLVSLMFISMTSNAQVGNRIIKDSISVVNANDSTKALEAISNTSYSDAYEKALKRKEELTNRKKILNDSIKTWNKELKQLEGLHASIVKSNEKLEEKIAQVKVKDQKSGSSELFKKRDQLLKAISADEKEKASLELQVQEIDGKLETRNHQRENLGRIKDDVTNQIIAENKDYLERPFSKMNLSELRQIKSKCQKYTTDSKVNVFVSKIDVAIKNKDLYDNMVNVVNSAYNKYNVDGALASASQIKGANTLQQKEVSELKSQLSLFADGLSAFKEFINKLNDMRNGVNYSMEYFQTDSKQILSKNNLGNRIENQLKRVPYLNKKFEEFMNAFKAAPNKHSNVETEILNQ